MPRCSSRVCTSCGEEASELVCAICAEDMMGPAEPGAAFCSPACFQEHFLLHHHVYRKAPEGPLPGCRSPSLPVPHFGSPVPSPCRSRQARSDSINTLPMGPFKRESARLTIRAPTDRPSPSRASSSASASSAQTPPATPPPVGAKGLAISSPSKATPAPGPSTPPRTPPLQPAQRPAAAAQTPLSAPAAPTGRHKEQQQTRRGPAAKHGAGTPPPARRQQPNVRHVPRRSLEIRAPKLPTMVEA